MAHGHATDAGDGSASDGHVELIPRDFLKVIAVWSLVPSYMVAGGFLGYLADRWLGLFPYMTGAGLLLSLVFAVRDMLRLRREM
jgi:hypothetical protein